MLERPAPARRDQSSRTACSVATSSSSSMLTMPLMIPSVGEPRNRVKTVRFRLIPATPGDPCNVGTPAYVLTIGTYGGIMLATVNAAEALFRHDAGTRAREMAILSSMRDRRQAMA